MNEKKRAISRILHDNSPANNVASQTRKNEIHCREKTIEALCEYFDSIHEWTPEDQLNADICEASDGMLSLSHV